MTNLDVSTIIHLLRDSERPSSHTKLMDDAATALSQEKFLNEMRQKFIDYQAEQLATLVAVVHRAENTIGYCLGRDFGTADKVIPEQMQSCWETLQAYMKIPFPLLRDAGQIFHYDWKEIIK